MQVRVGVVWTTLVTSGLAALLMLPPTVGTQALSSTTLSAPYAGRIGSNYWSYSGGCGGSLSSFAHFNRTGGVAHVALTAKSWGCGASAGSTVNASAAAWLHLGAFFASSGLHSIRLNWSVAWTVRIISPAPKGPCSCSGGASFELYAQLYDLSNGTRTSAGGTNWGAGNSTAWGSNLTWNGSGPVSMYINTTLKSGHPYSLWVVVAAYVSSLSRLKPGIASVDVATHGRGANLSSVVIT